LGSTFSLADSTAFATRSAKAVIGENQRELARASTVPVLLNTDWQMKIFRTKNWKNFEQAETVLWLQAAVVIP
jgi:hypothetical protein